VSVERDPRTGEVLPDVPRKAADEAPGLFTTPRNVRRIIVGLFGLCGLLLLLDLLYHKHVHFAEEQRFGFYAFYGFVSCVSLVLVAKVLRVLIRRPEDYYDE
jgi:hypothetical protein